MPHADCTVQMLHRMRNELVDTIISSLHDNPESAAHLGWVVKSIDKSMGLAEQQSNEGSGESVASNSPKHNNTVKELSTDAHEFYRRGDRIIRIGFKQDGKTEYRTSFSEEHMRAFVKMLLLIEPGDEFQMNGGLLDKVSGTLSRDKAYVVKTWLVAGGIIKEPERNLYLIASDSVERDAEELWEKTPPLSTRSRPRPKSN